MRKKLYSYILLLLILTTDIVFGKDKNKTKIIKLVHKKHNHIKEKSDSDRIKRSLNSDEDRPFWANRGKRQIDDNIKDISRYDNYLENNERILKSRDLGDTNRPFWGNRGRRDSSSMENYVDKEYSGLPYANAKYLINDCPHSSEKSQKMNAKSYKKMLERREELVSPFWGNRGRRSSDESNEYSSAEPFWGNRGRRQQNKDDPFWGTRGRKKDDSPFWGNRGRREDEPFWGNRGRREDSTFWGNRGRRDEMEPFWGNRGKRDDEPFWGNRGRRQENVPFWGHRGRKEDVEPFWGNRGRRKDAEPFWGNRGRRKEDVNEPILDTINNVEEDIESLSRLKKSDAGFDSFWMNRGRNSKLKYLFSGPSRARLPYISRAKNLVFGSSKSSEPGTVHDNRMYVDEPHYIVVERSSRSSGEVDPYYISRGKKYYFNMHLDKAARDRRGAIEEIVKSVRNDPYYIARGKKDTDIIKIGNSTILNDEFSKVKDLICSSIDLIVIKNKNNKVKREIDNDRDRRTILKKLTAQLQIDPYFVSRGKKDDFDNKDHLEEFINDVAGKCNSNAY